MIWKPNMFHIAFAATVSVVFRILWSTTCFTDAHGLGGTHYHTHVQEQEYTVTLPDGSRQLVNFYKDRRRRRNAETNDYDDDDDDEEDALDWVDEHLDNGEEEEEEFRSLLWDNGDMDNVYVVERALGRTSQVRFMVSNAIDNNLLLGRSSSSSSSPDHGDRRFLEDAYTRCRLKPCPRPIIHKSTFHGSQSSDHYGNNDMPLGEYKVILPNGHDQFVTYSSSTSEAGIEADMAAWSSEIFHMSIHQDETGGSGRRRRRLGSSHHRQDRRLHWDDGMESIRPSGSYRLNRPDGSYHIVTYHVMDHDV